MLKFCKAFVVGTLICFGALLGFAQNIPQNGELAPDIVIPNSNGTSIHLNSLRGKVVLIDFWASWCGPCRMANEETIDVYKEYQPKGFEIFSISLDRKKEPWLRAIKDDNLPWPNHGCDFKEWNSESCTRYHVEALPTTYLIDEHGYIISTDVDYYDLNKILKKHFNKTIFYPRESANKLIITQETKFEIQTDEGKIISKGNCKEVDIRNLAEGDYMLKIDGREEHFKKIAHPIEQTNIFDDSLQIRFSKEATIKIYNKRGYKVLEKHNTTEIEKSLFEKGDYYIWIDGNMFLVTL